MRRALLAFVLVLAAARTVRADGDFVAQVADAVRDGDLRMTLAARPGRVPLRKGWDLVVTRATRLNATAVVSDGKVATFRFVAPDGDLVVVGRGLRPDVVVDELVADASGTIVTARFHGRGLGRPVIALFSGLGRSALRKVTLETRLPRLMRGDLLAPAAAPAPARSAPAAAPPTSAPAPTPSGPSAASFLALLEEARLDGSTFTAFSGKPLALGDGFAFETGAESPGAPPLALTLERARLRPEANEIAWELEGAFRARLAAGRLRFGPHRVDLAEGTVSAARFTARRPAGGETRFTLAASRLAVAASGGTFPLGSGLRVDVGTGSTLDIADVRLGSGAAVSGRMTFDFVGKTGEMSVKDGRLALRDVRLRGRDVAVAEGVATGDVDLDFTYRLEHRLVVRYPVENLQPAVVPLEFQGPFSAHLHADAFGAEGGRVDGRFTLDIPWDPIERAAIAALRARWVQDLPALRRVDFDVQPERFALWGEDGLTTGVTVVAEKLSSAAGKSLFRQVCHPEGRARLAVDTAARSFALRDVTVQPRCEGVVGKALNWLAPFFAKSYESIELFRLPDELPFSIETVRSGASSVRLTGRVAWTR